MTLVFGLYAFFKHAGKKHINRLGKWQAHYLIMLYIIIAYVFIKIVWLCIFGQELIEKGALRQW